jgi:hypothetical protein
VHEADLDDERYDASEARGLDVLLRGLSMVRPDHELLELSGSLYDGLWFDVFWRRSAQSMTNNR